MESERVLGSSTPERVVADERLDAAPFASDLYVSGGVLFSRWSMLEKTQPNIALLDHVSMVFPIALIMLVWSYSLRSSSARSRPAADRGAADGIIGLQRREIADMERMIEGTVPPTAGAAR